MIIDGGMRGKRYREPRKIKAIEQVVERGYPARQVAARYRTGKSSEHFNVGTGFRPALQHFSI